MAKNIENGNTQMVRTTMAIPIDIGGGQVAKINLPPGATLAGPVKVLTLPNQQTIAHVTVMAPPGVVEKYVAQAAAESEASGSDAATPKTLSTGAAPTATSPVKPASPVKQSPAPSQQSQPSNLFDKLSSKPGKADPSTSEQVSTPKTKRSSSEDDAPLSKISSSKEERNETPPVEKKKSGSKKSSTDKSDKKPQTGFGAFLEEKRPELMKKRPGMSEKEMAKEVKSIWDSLDIPKKNHYIRNSDAYKLKKGIITPEQLSKSEKKSTKQSSPTSKTSSPTEDKSDTVPSKSEVTSSKDKEESDSGYNYPKRNIKRKYFDVDEDNDIEDADWTLPEQKSNPLDGAIPSSLPPLKFKKKSKHSGDSVKSTPLHYKTEKGSDDLDLPSVMDIEEKPSEPPPIAKKTEALKHEVIKESTPPPPLRKIESAVPTSDRKSNLKLICLHEGCYEEATTEATRGKYWCSNKCCILYSKVIFNAWLGARRANMID